ncbi:hypothetical protein [Kitasatospora sp. NPDC057198]|uniref:hypothetical protein n=1 Tax=Kitasatospora sp. NPDC057198 TaxID=3346046 RepID=UPI0036438D08
MAVEEPAEYTRAYRSETERLLRILRATGLWHSEPDNETRSAWRGLLEDPDLTGEQFDAAFLVIYEERHSAAECWDRFLELHRRFGEPLGIPTQGVSELPREEPAADEDFDEAADEDFGEDFDEAAGRGAEARFLHLAVVWPHSRRSVPADLFLASGRTYQLRLGIGEPAADNLLPPSSPALPEGPLDHADDDGRGDWLQVTAVSAELHLPAERYWIFLPLHGDAWVCHCPPGGRHGCAPDHRGRHLHIPFVTPEEPGPARLLLIVSHRGNQLQSATATFSVAAAERPGGATGAVVDHTLTPGFTGLDALPRRAAAVRVGRRDGAMTVDVTAEDGPAAAFWLSEHQVVAVLEQVRADLLACHSELRVQEGREVRVNLLDRANRKDPDALRRDMTRLARRGWSLYQMVARTRPEREALRRVLDRPSTIQICRTELNDLAFPWALLYDIPVEADAPLGQCGPGWEQLRRDPTARACPDRTRHPLNTLCPYGFWGFKHIIEQPASVPGGGRVHLEAGPAGAAPSLTVARSTRFDPTGVERHLAALRAFFPDLRVCDRKDAFRLALTGAPSTGVYFFGHGLPARVGEDTTPTVLEIGHDDRILPEDLAAWGEAPEWEQWARSGGPLVFLNGCHTVDHDARTWLPFVDVLAGLHAAGVIGTEITVVRGLAEEFAERFWELMLSGQDVGSALHRTRMELLGRGNVLGLAYTAYCSAALRLRTAG